MARPIDADELMKRLNRKEAGPHDRKYTEGFNDALMRFRSMVHSAHTISADEASGVVHCGECKFWRRPPSCEGLARCETGETGIRYRSKNDFCSRGAKMEVE